MMNIFIERISCISCGACWGRCPEFFEENKDDGLSQVTAKFRIAGKLNEGVVFEDLEECVNKATRECPVQVIHTSSPTKVYDLD
ncbi:MAG: hypothetical protein A4E49_00204 [Methanosaeta sp. PtaU1.Bin112]|nr:MAG: hypothetical protein A4E49_00204 [Methanosaeta sp. PtaU1.Bin112]